MDCNTYKIKYSISCAVIFSAAAFISLYLAELRFSSGTLLVFLVAGSAAGFIIGLMKDRWTTANRRLEDMVHLRTSELKSKALELESSRKHIRILKTLLPVCTSCKSICDTSGNWNEIESYLEQLSDNTPAHLLCPGCAQNIPSSFQHHTYQDKH